MNKKKTPQGIKLAPRPSRPMTPRENSAILETIIAGLIYFENMDLIKGTVFYEGDLKRKINILMPELEKAVNRGADMLMGDNSDFKGFYCLSDDARIFMRQMALLTSGQKSLFNNIAALIKERGDWVISQLGIEVIESDQIEEWKSNQATIDKFTSSNNKKQLSELISLLAKAPISAVNSVLITAKSLVR